MTIDVEYLEYLWPMRHYLITCGDTAGEANILTVSFCMPVSKDPPLAAIAVGKAAYSRKLIEDGREFVINVPTQDLESQAYYCGTRSGRDVDKFKETGLTREPARSVRPPIIAECVAHMECKVVKDVEAGDKILFVGEVVEAYADDAVARGVRKVEYAGGRFPRHVYGTRFGTAQRRRARDRLAPDRK
jgi:flavin reductase (DIM6/NTAB) family NADH-FMN oxidoreductase RutF